MVQRITGCWLTLRGVLRTIRSWEFGRNTTISKLLVAGTNERIADVRIKYAEYSIAHFLTLLSHHTFQALIISRYGLVCLSLRDIVDLFPVQGREQSSKAAGGGTFAGRPIDRPTAYFLLLLLPSFLSSICSCCRLAFCSCRQRLRFLRCRRRLLFRASFLRFLCNDRIGVRDAMHEYALATDGIDQ